MMTIDTQASNPREISEHFSSWCSSLMLTKRTAQKLVVPEFGEEFNRCVEHRELMASLHKPFSEQTTRGWFEIGAACRLNDMRKVDSGRHSTVFELLTMVQYYAPSDQQVSRRELSSQIFYYLVNVLGLDKNRLRLTYFGGGTVLPGVERMTDNAWRDAWLDLGIKSNNLISVKGLKNYILFVGEGERCGPKCEIMYQLGDSSAPVWLEIGTAIIDDEAMKKIGNAWVIERTPTICGGIAFGLDRLVAACNNSTDPECNPATRVLYQEVIERSGQISSGLSLMKGDALILIDQARACCFLLADGVTPDSSPHGKALITMLRRIRRKISVLCIDDWHDLIHIFEAEIRREYGVRFPALSCWAGSLISHLLSLQWPEVWNPDSYVSLALEQK